MLVGTQVAIRENNNDGAGTDRLLCLIADVLNGLFQIAAGVSQIDDRIGVGRILMIGQQAEFGLGENWRVHHQTFGVALGLFKDIELTPETGLQ